MNKYTRAINTTEQSNLNKLTSYVKDRLRSNQKSTALDTHGNVVYIDVDIFSDSIIENLLFLSLSEFNQTPAFTYLTFNDTAEIETFSSILVEGAVLYCLSSQALIERGREFSYNDNGISFTPPSVGDMMMTQYQSMFPIYWEKLKLIKNEFRPRAKLPECLPSI